MSLVRASLVTARKKPQSGSTALAWDVSPRLRAILARESQRDGTVAGKEFP